MSARDPAEGRWAILTLVRIVAAAGAVFGLVLAGRAVSWGPKMLGVAIVLSALSVMAIVPRALVERWRGPRP